MRILRWIAATPFAALSLGLLLGTFIWIKRRIGGDTEGWGPGGIIPLWLVLAGACAIAALIGFAIAPLTLPRKTRTGAKQRGGPGMPEGPTSEEKARALAALRSPAQSVDARLTAPDGSFVLYVIGRNFEEVPDPDAGSVLRWEPALGLWDCKEAAWRWETQAAPPEYTFVYVAERATFELSHDGSGLYVTPSSHPRSSRLYDVATGKLRPEMPGDRGA